MTSTTSPRLTVAHRETMGANPWFARMPLAQQEALLDASELTHWRRGAMLFRQGDPVSAAGSGLYGLARGLIKASTLRQDGREAILSVVEPGNWFGEISLIDGSPRTHDATALTPVDLLTVPPEAFARLMQDVVFANAIAALLAARVRFLYELMEDATLRGLRARVARRLCTLARGDATQSPVVRRNVRLSQEALAMMLGVTRQTLSGELTALEAAGMISLGYGRIGILDIDALERCGTGG
ncbi:Crp/Fnr family transcriptional regulator [Variovorax robiniae]|uniref:Crp/Fnr family transcriptional regulator n=1 Tax=Variovorax robiniae TaxID=1836199 RepID=A0ABU8XF42_9BURK